MRAHFGLPSVESEDLEAKRPITVNFEIPYFTVSGIQVGPFIHTHHTVLLLVFLFIILTMHCLTFTHGCTAEWMQMANTRLNKPKSSHNPGGSCSFKSPHTLCYNWLSTAAECKSYSTTKLPNDNDTFMRCIWSPPEYNKFKVLQFSCFTFCHEPVKTTYFTLYFISWA